MAIQARISAAGDLFVPRRRRFHIRYTLFSFLSCVVLVSLFWGDGCKKGGAGTIGIAPLDCKNSNKNDLVLVFGDKLSSARQLAFVIAHELGHSFGPGYSFAARQPINS